MIENNPLNVSSAFDTLLEEVEAEIDFVNHVGARAFEGRSLDKAKEALERSGFITAFRDKVATLRKEWDELAAVAQREEDEETQTARRNLGRLRRGQRTPESAYYEPILRALTEMGGAGRMQDVLERLGKLMRPTLTDLDYQPLASNPETMRWRNAAQWARYTMVKEGLLKPDSPRGLWEISSLGRERLSKA
ncbi:MAG TPA: winged helix-turn-helix domain-containing protein [Verrucomicrobiae bacterium]|nr:winged helix-turn-helix domain-containing protein [Verrucomicrobiae bacterium]